MKRGCRRQGPPSPPKQLSSLIPLRCLAAAIVCPTLHRCAYSSWPSAGQARGAHATHRGKAPAGSPTPAAAHTLCAAPMATTHGPQRLLPHRTLRFCALSLSASSSAAMAATCAALASAACCDAAAARRCCSTSPRSASSSAAAAAAAAPRAAAAAPAPATAPGPSAGCIPAASS